MIQRVFIIALLLSVCIFAANAANDRMRLSDLSSTARARATAAAPAPPSPRPAAAVRAAPANAEKDAAVNMTRMSLYPLEARVIQAMRAHPNARFEINWFEPAPVNATWRAGAEKNEVDVTVLLPSIALAPELEAFNKAFTEAVDAIEADKDYNKTGEAVWGDFDAFLAKSMERSWAFWQDASDRGSFDKLYALFDTNTTATAPSVAVSTNDETEEGPDLALTDLLLIQTSPRDMLWMAARHMRDGFRSALEDPALRKRLPKFVASLEKIRDDVKKARARAEKDEKKNPADTPAERGRNLLLFGAPNVLPVAAQ